MSEEKSTDEKKIDEKKIDEKEIEKRRKRSQPIYSCHRRQR